MDAGFVSIWCLDDVFIYLYIFWMPEIFNTKIVSGNSMVVQRLGSAFTATGQV